MFWFSLQPSNKLFNLLVIGIQFLLLYLVHPHYLRLVNLLLRVKYRYFLAFFFVIHWWWTTIIEAVFWLNAIVIIAYLSRIWAWLLKPRYTIYIVILLIIASWMLMKTYWIIILHWSSLLLTTAFNLQILCHRYIIKEVPASLDYLTLVDH